MSSVGEDMPGVHSGGARSADAAGAGYTVFFSLRFGAEHRVIPMAEQLRDELDRRGAKCKIVNMAAGGDIDTEVFQGIEECATFLVFGSAKYGEDTGNQACTYFEYKHAFAKKKRIILIRMIPFDQEFDELQARVIFNANRLVLPWLLGDPMPGDLPDKIIEAISPGGVALGPPPPGRGPSRPEPAAPVAASGGRRTVEALLHEERLTKYVGFMAEEGYVFVHDLLEADQEDVQELVASSGMKKPEVKRFMKAVAGVRPEGADDGAAAAGADATADVQQQVAAAVAAERTQAERAIAAAKADAKRQEEEAKIAVEEARAKAEAAEAAAAASAAATAAAEADAKRQEEAAAAKIAAQEAKAEVAAAAAAALSVPPLSKTRCVSHYLTASDPVYLLLPLRVVLICCCRRSRGLGLMNRGWR